MISIGGAGLVVPMFELAKSMKNHNVTFITELYAQSYVNFTSHPNLSSFRIIYSNDSTDAFIDQKKTEKEVLEYFTNHSLFDNLSYLTPGLGISLNALMNKTVHLLMVEQFDVIIGCSMIFGINALCKEAKTSCVIQFTEIQLDFFDFNQPNSFSLLSSTQLTKWKYRVYNVAFTLRAIMSAFKQLKTIFYTIFQSFPQVPGPFYETFTLKNLLLTKFKCLQLFNLPPTLYSPSSSHHWTKYLGAYVDESTIDNTDNDLTKWIKSKPPNSMVYAAFGSTGIIELDRMKNLITGLAAFLLQTDTASVLLAFRNINYDKYQIVLNEITNNEYRRVLLNDQRVKIEREFVQQKWILQQKSVNLFLSHCGMGSAGEGLYFQKPILCLPLQTDQFFNAIAIEQSGVGQSLFKPPSLLQSFLNPVDFHDYTFSANDVTTKLLIMWRNSTFENAVRIMSAEMKHAGGVKQAVKEIEFLVKLNGDLNRYAPFQSTLPFYQQFMVDLVIVYIVIPGAIIFYLFVKCCKQSRKKKID
ncbi:unnamed protein product [Didymodactylos carnosus]|uniref:UDP-glucuronosyltransferase n=1 Tax=Didymodactylos carnosus TaxID=1234261 RepID=A0A814EQY0_9BILA|nr:unnamed protein product [Didymodactylos carnosus]CAF0972526.1 unnamed protein product [Didymodactylos carnosus]CAF3562243.1 unnamed protein product [Didymodactylos carnosus]CAF3745507.1 unnamed protein product [Didymodactylos carnosus]